VSFAAITLYVASQRVFVVVVSLSTQSRNFWIHLHICLYSVRFVLNDCITNQGKYDFSYQVVNVVLLMLQY
jgi:hypothetical protein